MQVDPCWLLRLLHLSEKTISEIFPLCEVRTFQEGEVIEFGSSIFDRAPFLLQSGFVSSRHKNSNPSMTIADIYGPKTLLGESILFEDFQPQDYRCETTTRVLALPTKEMLMAISKDRMFANHLTKLAYWRYKLGQCNQNVSKTKDAFLRVVFLLSYFLLALSQSHSYEEDKHGIAIDGELSVPINQSVLATHFDVSRTIFSQCLQKLEAKGLLYLGYGHIDFLELELWKNFYQTHRKNELTNLELLEINVSHRP